MIIDVVSQMKYRIAFFVSFPFRRDLINSIELLHEKSNTNRIREHDINSTTNQTFFDVPGPNPFVLDESDNGYICNLIVLYRCTGWFSYREPAIICRDFNQIAFRCFFYYWIVRRLFIDRFNNHIPTTHHTLNKRELLIFKWKPIFLSTLSYRTKTDNSRSSTETVYLHYTIINLYLIDVVQ